MKQFSWPAKPGVLAGAVLMFAGCAHEPRQAVVYTQPAPVYSHGSQPTAVYVDDYVYYPDYRIYYGARTDRYYFFREGYGWTHGKRPPGVSERRLRNSRSVPVPFHDGVENHHAQFERQHPGSWRQNSGPKRDHIGGPYRNQQGFDRGETRRYNQ